MTAIRIDGKAVAEALRATIATAVASLNVTPGLAVVLVGEDPARQVYVRNKIKACEEAGIASFHHTLPIETSQADLITLLDRLNADASVHGILVQLPLPGHIDEQTVIERIDPAKDVDGFHPVNVGRLSLGLPALEPCTPRGCVILAQSVRQDLSGLHAVIVGRSNIVGKPMAQMLLAENCTVTIAHSRTRDLAAMCRQADILFANTSRPDLVRGLWYEDGMWGYTTSGAGVSGIPRRHNCPPEVALLTLVSGRASGVNGGSITDEATG